MSTDRSTNRQLFTVICLVLALGTFILYLPVRHNGFTNFDDPAYLSENPHINTGLTRANILWSFERVNAGYWVPLTWISFMAECQFFGLNAGYDHLVSVGFHIATMLLLFVWLTELTGAIWRSAFVAALFAWHPMHVESVAWTCERKDVMSAFFWMLTLIVYSHYVRARLANHRLGVAINYLLGLFFFACGFMSKPMVVTLPFVLLLVDFWPLKRFTVPGPEFNVKNLAKLCFEKVPFFGVAAIGGAIGFLTQTVGGAVSSDTLASRVMNALGSYVRYISKLFWPVDLSIFYPFPAHGAIALAVVAVLLLGACSLAFIILSPRWPYLFVGWFWFLGTLVPVIGIIQAGSQSMADRFIYIPSIGFFIFVTWAVADICKSRHAKIIPAVLATAVLATAVLAACVELTSIQIQYWRSSLTVFKHALAVTTDNYVADALIGQALDAEGRDGEALGYCQKAVQINPDYPPGQFFYGIVLWKTGHSAQAYNYLNTAAKLTPRDPIFEYKLGEFLAESGQADQAAARFDAAIQNKPEFAEAHNALGKTYLKQGKIQPAADQLAQAATLAPDNAQFHYDLGTVLLSLAKPDQAIEQFSRAIHLQPDFVLAHENLAAALAQESKLPQAIEHFSKVAQLQPNNPEAHFNLGFAYLNSRQPAQATEQFAEELRLTPNETKAHYRLAQALQEQNQLPQAVSEYRQALRLTPNFPDARTALNEILAAHPQLR